VVAIAHQVVRCADDVGCEGAEFLGGRIVAIRILALRVLGDSPWVKDSKAFLPGPLVLAGLFLRFSDLFVASACPATALLRREWRQACVFLSFLSGIPASARVPPPRNESDHQLKQCRRLHLASWRGKALPSAGRNRALARTAVCAVLGRMVHRHRIDLDQCPVEPSSCSLGAGRVGEQPTS